MRTGSSIPWLDEIDEAKMESAALRKPVLMFFHYKHCTGCINTFNKTLTKMSVIDEVNESFSPVLIEVTERPDEASAYNVLWTPTFIVSDKDGGEVDRWEGYLPEDDFLGHLDMALARVSLKRGDYKDAERRFDEVVIKYPLSDLAPKAMYYLGVAKYRETRDASQLTRAYEQLKDAYPESVWSEKASAWSRESIEASKKAA